MKIKVHKGWKIARNEPGKYMYSKQYEYFKITASHPTR
jgi:hypothetical protein